MPTTTTSTTTTVPPPDPVPTIEELDAFAWTEVLTKIDPGRDLEPYRAELARHFDAHGIAALTAMIGMINLWNRLQVAAH